MATRYHVVSSAVSSRSLRYAQVSPEQETPREADAGKALKARNFVKEDGDSVFSLGTLPVSACL